MEEFYRQCGWLRAYFTAEEIKDFEKYQYKIDEALLSGDVDAPFEVFNLYRKSTKKDMLILKTF